LRQEHKDQANPKLTTVLRWHIASVTDSLHAAQVLPS